MLYIRVVNQVLAHEWLREKQAIKSSVTQLDLADRNTSVRRRGASATTNFYKAMLKQMREEEENRDTSDSSHLAAVREVLPVGVSEQYVPQEAQGAEASVDAGSTQVKVHRRSIQEQSAAPSEVQQRSEPSESQPPSMQREGSQTSENGGLPPQRRPGAAMTREEWDEIRRHRQTAKEEGKPT